MKKVSIATYCTWTSYGSMYQSLALSSFLSSLGCDTALIRLSNENSSTYQPRLSRKNIKGFASFFFSLLIQKKTRRRYFLSCNFLSKRYHFSEYPNYRALFQAPPSTDFYIAGSDQIWHPRLNRPDFLLDFVQDPTKKISYAASMGDLNIPEDKKDSWFQKVDSFRHISVREKDVAQLIQSKLNRDVAVHIDPTFLMDQSFWRSLEMPYRIKEPYILLYAIYWDKSKNAELKALHRRTGMPVIAVSSGLQLVYANKRIYDASPQEFLWLVDHASYVVTSSFHGVAFSLIFNKRFSAVVNPALPSRINSLLDVLEVSNKQISELDTTPSIDYSKINRNIEKERQRAHDYLTGAIYGS